MEKIKKYLSTILTLSAQPGNKSVVRQLTEMLLLFIRSRLGPGFYLLAQMYRQDFPLRNVLGYLSTAGYKRQVYRLNNRLYHKSSQNKVIEKAVLTAYGQPTPELLGHYDPLDGLAIDGSSLRTAADLKALLEKQQGKTRICFKLIESWGGQGFRAIEYHSAGQVKDLETGAWLETDSFVSSIDKTEAGGVLIEKYLEQHQDYAAINQSSVNTLRIGVLKKRDGTIDCLLAFLRAGRPGTIVDNTSAGGILFPIDVATGIAKAGYTKYQPRVFYEKHPDSLTRLAGTRMPMFTEAVELAKNSLHVFPGIRFAGVDIAFSVAGPVILELNIYPDYNDFTITRLPSRNALNG
jgi:hypothetical protein